MMRRRIKPFLVFVFLSLFMIFLFIAKTQSDSVKAKELKTASETIPSPLPKSTTKTKTSSAEDTFVLNPIIDVSGWQLPSEIDYDTLSQNISGAIVRVYGGSQITKSNAAAHTTGLDKSFKTHIREFQKRDVPVAVYSYALGASVKEMKEEAQIFYNNAAPYNPTFYWIDVEEKTMANMDAGVRAFREELERLGAENIGLYIGTYFMTEHGISADGFDAIWLPAYGNDSGYYNAAPQTDMAYDLHQYTSNGYLNGFRHPLDLNQIAPTATDAKAIYEKLFGKLKEE